MTHRRGYPNTEARRARKHSEAEERREERSRRSPELQLGMIKQRRGESKREVEKLLQSVAARKKEPVKKVKQSPA